MENETKQPLKHQGRKVMKIRELLGVTQETLAEKLGISQQAISSIEQKDIVEEAMLGRIAKALGVTPEAIKNLDENAVVYNIVTNNGSVNGLQNYNCTFNPLDKLMESIEEIKNLYEKLLKSEQEKNALLQKIIDEKK